MDTAPGQALVVRNEQGSVVAVAAAAALGEVAVFCLGQLASVHFQPYLYCQRKG